MIFGGLEFLLYGFLVGTAVGVIIELVIITFEAIIQAINDWISGRNKNYVVNPDILEDAGLREKIKKQNGKHKRLVVNFNQATKKWEDARLVTSDQIDSELLNEDIIEIVTR